MKRYVAGLDGGGTKTAVTVADEHGLVVHAFTSGAINYNGQDADSIRHSFQDIFEEIAGVCGGLENCGQIVIGAAGVSNPTVSARLEANVRECGYQGKLFITGDQETALCGAHDSEYGIILIAGTGSICYGKNEDGVTHRAGGYGHLIDDEGSGYSIGRDLLSALVRAQDGRIEGTVIAGMVYEQLQLSTVQQIIGFVYNKETNKKDIAALAPILSEACTQGDETALAIAAKSAESLFEIAVPVVEKLSLQQGSLAMAGSVLLNNSYVRSAFVKRLGERYPDLTCITAKKDAASGAVLMALNRLD
ncbi:N-acetylglucosamine kinase [Paenibacillus aceris]|uniref:N-acetylglucosamine kinase-like BadF-type ATPase n=1 Tax=Paenibacillus aceris TaxID=869555 RepID=A0ABS4I859_9BACL|nr:BadF/BadG/BcrA/BcrD ATPase family protein [Paenibacillus aceris]MBP1966279.1 N-acetylglucosamine kinase-like BadF-type ATPase [Paenibacillus aceris]NHW38540.1 ATPase [Paenibacillus aceris]